MTVEEINNIYYINKEIEKIQKELYDLRNKNFYGKNILTGMPKGNWDDDIFSIMLKILKRMKICCIIISKCFM